MKLCFFFCSLLTVLATFARQSPAYAGYGAFLAIPALLLGLVAPFLREAGDEMKGCRLLLVSVILIAYAALEVFISLPMLHL
jgi:hypothetical protein